ncbi:hypothetical protein B0H94_105246 [Salsuginibacillus halophilus]|uniref:Uncharacterized protein n=1 Tax=Salsuginibacillus halophilus TaxID=517424 RepID=A0A2P8HLL0_9BACI|nr:hypothetical protein [Salsuginibacillus halophilus]PSL47090.1 hypothetical protein B0H94_105246 [Salsuginibacillus halophilus]
MVVLIYLKRVFEREMNQRKALPWLHGINIVLVLMIYGTAVTAFAGVTGGVISEQGAMHIFLKSTIYPLPIISGLYPLVHWQMKQLLRPYIKEKGSNVLYLKPRIYKRYGTLLR